LRVVRVLGAAIRYRDDMVALGREHNASVALTLNAQRIGLEQPLAGLLQRAASDPLGCVRALRPSLARMQ
jgi:hypothetical protein